MYRYMCTHAYTYTHAHAHTHTHTNKNNCTELEAREDHVVAVCCSVLQGVDQRIPLLQCVAMCSSVLQCIAV